jgi:hypothetical protein
VWKNFEGVYIPPLGRMTLYILIAGRGFGQRYHAICQAYNL